MNDTMLFSEIYERYFAMLADEARPIAHQTNRRELYESDLIGRFGSVAFNAISSTDFQSAIDAAAVQGDSRKAERLKNLFVDVEKFAHKKGYVESSRTRKLVAPVEEQAPRTLGDQEFGELWRSLTLLAEGGGVPDRAPSLLLQLSALTLRSPAELLRMRRADLVSEFWVRPDGSAIYLSSGAKKIVEKASLHADFVHREISTEFLFPSAGPKRDPQREASFSMVYDVLNRVKGRAEVFPNDLRHTAVVALKRLGSEDFSRLIDNLAYGTPRNDQSCAALLEAWSDRIAALSQKRGR